MSMKQQAIVKYLGMIMATALISACGGPIKPQIHEYVNQPMVTTENAQLSLCKPWPWNRFYEMRPEEPHLAPYYCVVNKKLGHLDKGTYFHITKINYNGLETCFNPPDIIIDSGPHKGQRAHLMYFPMQVENPAVNGCQLLLPTWATPYGVTPPFNAQKKALGIA